MKLKLTLEYDGSAFCGWQFQPGQPSIQQAIQDALVTYLASLQKKVGCPNSAAISLTASGRTDAGVHARGQVAAFDWPDGLNCDLELFRRAVQGLTPRSINILSIKRVDESFCPRRSPHVKCYSYCLKLSRAACGLKRDRAWFIGEEVNIPEMISASRHFVGEHDFSAFRSSNCTAKSTKRTLLCSELARVSHDELLYVVQGKGFLKQMVRIIVGTIVDIGRGKFDSGAVLHMLAQKNRENVGKTAPAHGLTLEWVRYGENPQSILTL